MIRAHVEAIAARRSSQTDQLAASLRGRAWPGGGADRSEPAARDWLRRWHATGPAPLAVACSCASGHCLVCN